MVPVTGAMHQTSVYFGSTSCRDGHQNARIDSGNTPEKRLVSRQQVPQGAGNDLGGAAQVGQVEVLVGPFGV